MEEREDPQQRLQPQVPSLEGMSLLINNLTVHVDEPTHYEEALTTAPAVTSVSSESVSNGLRPNSPGLSDTNLSSDGSEPPVGEGVAALYEKDADGRIPAYVDFTQLEAALATLDQTENPLLS